MRRHLRTSTCHRLVGLLVAAAVVAAGCGSDSSTADAAPFEPIEPELLFASGFAEGTNVSADLLDIVGTDAETGFSWEATPAWVESTSFYYGVKDPAQISDFMGTEISETDGPDGATTRALKLTNKGDDPDEPSLSRNELSFFGREEDATFGEGTIRYWTRLQPDLDQVVPDDVTPRLYYFMEAKDRAPGKTGTASGHSGFRINIGITRSADTGELFWVATGEQVQPERVIDWQDRNVDVAVPLGEWFEVEAYLRRHPTDGRLYFAVNGETVFDLTVSTQHRDSPRPLLFWSPFKLYHDPSWWAAGPTEQWYDDLEVWNGLAPDLELSERVQP